MFSQRRTGIAVLAAASRISSMVGAGTKQSRRLPTDAFYPLLPAPGGLTASLPDVVTQQRFMQTTLFVALRHEESSLL